MLENVQISDKAIFVTMDIESLYTNINQNKIIDIIEKLLSDNNNKNNFNNNSEFENNLNFINDNNINKLMIIDFLKFILKNNYIKFNDILVKQIHGIAMGTAVAPVLANIFLWYLETDLINSLKNSNPKLIPKYYFRYLDDVLFIWEESILDLKEFLIQYNKMDIDIKAIPKYNKTQMEFLDVIIYKNIDNKIKFKLHQKKLNKYLYVPFNSCHPQHTFKGIIKTELIRYVRNNSYLQDFLIIRRKFMRRLLQRGYPMKLLCRIFKEVKFENRNKYLIIKNKNEHNKKLIPFVLQYSSILKFMNIPHIIHDMWNKYILDNNQEEFNNENLEFIKNLKPLISWKQPSNLMVLINKFNNS
jgi:hypothetical protein